MLGLALPNERQAMADVVFVIDGKDYESPDISTLTMGERRVMFDLAGVVQEDFVQDDDETDAEHEARISKMTRHPGFLESLMHIAYARGNPALKRDRVQSLIEGTNFQEAIAKWADSEDESLPPVLESTSTLDGRLPIGPVDSSLSSGDGLSNGSGLPAETPPIIGTTKSDTSLTSVQETSAA